MKLTLTLTLAALAATVAAQDNGNNRGFGGFRGGNNGNNGNNNDGQFRGRFRNGQNRNRFGFGGRGTAWQKMPDSASSSARCRESRIGGMFQIDADLLWHLIRRQRK